MEEIKLKVNGEENAVPIEKNWTLLYVLRDVLDLTGAKCGCNTGDCGACKVIIDGEAVNSCLVLAVEADGGTVLTVEGLAGDELHPLQQAFLDVGAVQCGFCTPGMLLSAKALLDRNPHPDEAFIRKNIEGNICRCTGYDRIVQAILLAAERMS